MVVFGDENIFLLKEILAPYCDYYPFSGRKLTNKELIESNCKFLFTRSQTAVCEELLKNTSVEIVATATSGIDHFNEEYLIKNNIKYFDAKGSNSNSVAEYVLYGILKWAIKKNLNLNEQVLGIVGYGCIGKKISAYAASLGMKVLVNDPPLFDTDFSFPDYINYVELNNLIEQSDIITNHVPLIIDGKYRTYKLFNKENLKKIKSNSLFIHSSRGGIVDEEAILSELFPKNCEIIIDVWENEPDFNPILAEKCFISTPHIAGYSLNGKLNGTEIIIDVFSKFSVIEIDKSYLNKFKSELISINNFENTEKIYRLLKENRKIHEDAKLFNNLIHLNKKDKVSEFDKQRKYYPQRLESLNPFI